jgi:hypothetical protein
MTQRKILRPDFTMPARTTGQALSLFWDAEGNLFYDLTNDGRRVTSDFELLGNEIFHGLYAKGIICMAILDGQICVVKIPFPQFQSPQSPQVLYEAVATIAGPWAEKRGYRKNYGPMIASDIWPKFDIFNE